MVVLFEQVVGDSSDNDTAIVTSQSTCTGIEKLAADLMANVSGSTCDIDRDNNICNDCLQLNCTIRVGSAFGVALPIPVFSSIYPCYEDNNTHAVEIIFPDLLRIFTINTTSQVVAISLGGFVGDYRVDVTVEQKGNGFNYGMAVQQDSGLLSFTVFEVRFIPVQCREVPASTCLTPGPGLNSGLSTGEISAIAVCMGVPGIAVILGAILIAIIVVVKRGPSRRRHKNRSPSVANNYSMTVIPNDAVFAKNEVFGMENEDHTYTDISPYFSFSPKYGVTVPDVDFHHFNVNRKGGGIDKWDYPRDKLIYMRELGEGQFGKVLLMRAQGIAGYNDSVPVAVKTLASTDKQDRLKFLEETELMKKFTHPNIVSLLGTCGEVEDGAPMMILELMPYGDLKSFLSKQKEDSALVTSVCEFEVYHIAADIASALAFLAESKYVHRDIAARNCLVGENLRVKLADFGLARPVHENDCYTLHGPAQLPLRWMAPESIIYGLFSTKSDVWSFGVLLYEVVTFGETPYNDYEVKEIVDSAKNGVLKLPRPETCPELLYSIMRQCQEHKADYRPEFLAIRQMLTRERAKSKSSRIGTKINI